MCITVQLGLRKGELRQKAVSRKVAYDTERLEGPDQTSPSGILEGTVSEPTTTLDFFHLYPSDITMKSPLLRTPDSAPDSDVSMSPAMVPRVSFFARTPRPPTTTLHNQLVDVNNVLSPQLEAMSISPRLPIAQPSVTCHRGILSPVVRMHSLTP